MSGIYLHIPYCRKACHYCDFHFSTNLKTRSEFVASLLKEIELQAATSSSSGEKIETIYFGGGTPSLLSLQELSLILEKLNSFFDLSNCQEITLEANPEDISKASLDSWLQLGVNRLSVGVQSFKDKHLQSVNRAHGAKQSFEAIDLIHASGFDNYTIDLMFGIPPFDTTEWKEDLRLAAELKVPHLSVYGLTIEANTVFGSWQKKGKLIETKEDEMAWAFRYAHDFLEGYHYQHYEISNYALAGKESNHNSAYWEGKKYLGFGPGAHSFDGRSRSFNVSNNIKYIKSLSSGNLPRSVETLTFTERLNEVIFTSLRTQKGLDLAQLQTQFEKDLLKDHEDTVAQFVNDKLLTLDNSILKLTLDGMLLADEISLKMLYG